MRLWAMLGVAGLVGCSPLERLTVELPSARPLILARHHHGETLYWAIDPARDTPPLDPLTPWDGDPVTFDAVELDPAALGIALGPLRPPSAAGAADALLARAGDRVGAIYSRALEGDGDSGWQSPSATPATLAELSIPRRSSCDAYEVQIAASSTVGLSYTSLAPMRGRAGAGRALVGAGGPGGVRGWLGVATSTSVVLRRLGFPDAEPIAMAWDGVDTGWSVIVSQFLLEQRVVELDRVGRERSSITIRRIDNEVVSLAITADRRAIVYSANQVLELSRGATVARDVTSAYPPQLVSLLEAAPDQRYAIAPVGTVRHFREGQWSFDGSLPRVSRLYLVGGQPAALAEDTLYRRGADGVWSAVPDKYPTINKLSVAELPTGELLLSGGAGLLAVYQDSQSWCEVQAGTTRYLSNMQFAGDAGIASDMRVVPDGPPSILYWILPR